MFYFDLPLPVQTLLNQYWLAANYFLLFLLFFLAYLSYKSPAKAGGILLILLPTYLFRTKIFGLPSTYLELSFAAVFIPWFIKNLKQHSIGYWIKLPLVLFIIAATISIFVAPDRIAALGLWKAYFIEPVLFFFFLIHTIKNENDKKFLFWCLGISTIPIAILATYQKITGWGIAEPSWVSADIRRVTAFYTSPNAVGLYLGPITIIYLGWLLDRIRNRESGIRNIFVLIIFILNILAIVFTKSQGTWLGLLAGMIFLSYFLINKKWTLIISGLIILFILLIPVTQKIVWPYITFSDPSGQNRLTLWSQTTRYLLSSPQNFLFGTGIYGFPKVHKTFRDPAKTEPLIYPHNIFLNFWMDIGLLGLISICWIIFLFFKKGFADYKLKAISYKLIIMSAMVVIIVHGLIDVPYFKNDLAILFWSILALGILP